MTNLFLFILLLLFGLWAFQSTKRKKSQSFPKHWHNILIKYVLYYKELSKSQQQIFQNKMMQFLNEVTIDPVHIELQETDTVLIAASAVIPVFGFDNWKYTNLNSIILYPDHFNEDLQFSKSAPSRKIAGMVGTGRFEKQMILSKKALYQGFENKTDKNNTAIHEFVHLLDKTDGIIDGIPEMLLKHQYAIPWLEMIHSKMEAINKDQSDIRSYGGTNKAEFFAVASEYFFERPKLLKRKHPELYAMLAQCFQQQL